MRYITLRSLKNVNLTLKAALSLSSNCLTYPDGQGITVDAAKTIVANMKNHNASFNVAHMVPVAQSIKDCFNYTEEVADYQPPSVTSPVVPQLTMTVTTPAPSSKSSPTVKADVTLQDGILERALKSALTSEVNNVINGLLPEFKKIIQHELSTNFVKRVEVKVNEGEWKDVGHQHVQFPELLRICMARLPSGERLNTWLVGSAGTGKTTACYNVAKALEARTFGAIGTSDNKYELSGFVDAQGKIVNTIFRDVFINGGVMLLDEIDSWYPNALLALQAALSNGFCAFPDGVFERHPDCIVICAANTYGQGEVTEYVGRMKQDAAFLDRFIFFKWEIDEQLERHISGNLDWVTRVQALRKRAAERGVKVLITPRASQYGAALLAIGVPWADVERMTVRKAMTAEQWKSIQ